MTVFNNLPIALSIQEDGTIKSVITNTERFFSAAAKRIGDGFEVAGRRSSKAFSLDDARRDVQQFAREIDSFRNRQAAKKTDLFGIQDSLKNIDAGPFNRIANEMMAAENRLAAQRAKAHAENMAALAQEAQAGINAINQRQAAQTAAFKQAEAEGNRLLQLDQQRIAEAAKMVAGPQFLNTPTFNPAGMQAAAAAARQFADEQRAIAIAANQAANAVEGAAAEQRAFALAMNNAADAAENEATRLQRLAAAQQSVASAAEAAGVKLVASNDSITNSVRGGRFATIQAAQQFQDFFIQIQGGQNVLVAFSQQASQLAFVMAGAEGKAGAFARFIAGGWGTAILGAIAIGGLFATKLFGIGEGADKAKKSNIDFTNSLEVSKAFVNDYANAIDKLSEATKGLINTQSLLLDSLLGTSKAAVADLNSQLSQVDARLAKLRQEGTGIAGSFNTNQVEIAQLQAQRNQIMAQIESARGSLAEAQAAYEQRAAQEAADPKAKKRREIQNQIDELALRRQNTIAMGNVPLAGQPTISEADFKRQTTELTKQLAALNKTMSESARGNLARSDTFISPIEGGRVTSGFGKRKAPQTPNGPGSSFHPAIDFAVPTGTAVRAPQVGTVSAIGFDKGLGKYIVIDHGAGTKSRFAHLSDTSAVTVGQRVEQGDVIAKSGNTGKSTGPHLDYQITRNGRPVDPRKGSFPIDAVATNERAEKIAEQAAERRRKAEEHFKQSAAQTAALIQGINDRWDEQPRLIDAAARDAQRLAQEVASIDEKLKGQDLSADQRKALEDMRAAAVATAKVVSEGLERPFAELLKDQQEQLAVMQQVAAGREDEANALEIIQRFEKTNGDLSEDRKEQILAGVVALRQQGEALERQQRLWDIQINQARELQDAFTGFLEDPFAKGGLKNLTASITQSRKRAIAQELSIKLFGDMGQDVEDRLRRGGDAVREAGESLGSNIVAISQAAKASEAAHGGAAKALTGAADNLNGAASALRASNDNRPSVGQFAGTPSAFLPNGASPTAVAEQFADIVVTGRRLRAPAADGDLGLDLGRLARELKPISVNLGKAPLADRFDAALGRLEMPLSYLSSALGGKAGFAIDSLLNTRQFKKMGDLITRELGGTLGKVAGGAVTGIGYGQAADSVVKLLGFKGSSTGGAIGGAIGNAILPGIGGFIGGTLGSLVGGMLKKTAFSTSGFNTKDGLLVKGNNTGNKASASRAAKGSRDAVVEGLNSVLERFGGTISGDPGVTVGVYDGKYRVSTTGHKGKLDFKGSSANGLVNFGKDGAEAAVKFAIQTIIEKGVISGIRASTRKLLASGDDLEKAIQKATDFENVFIELKGYTDPVGAAIDALDKRFTYLRKIFGEAGASAAEYADLEKLYGIKRAEAVEQASKNMTSALDGFLDSLNFSGETGLSLRTRQTNAKAKFDPIAADIMAGKTIDQEKFTEVAGSYLDIAREIYGSTQGYFDLLNQVTNLTGKAIENVGATNVTPITAAASAAASVATTSPAVQQAVETQTTTLGGKLDKVVAAIEQLRATGFLPPSTTPPAGGGGNVRVSASQLSSLRNA